MTPQIPIAETREFWLWCYARLSFRKVIGAGDRIAQEVKNDSVAEESLIHSVFINYSKPFLKCHGADRLPESIVPLEYRTLHRHILNLRNRTVAHWDGVNFKADDEAFGNILQIRLRVTRGEYTLDITEPDLRSQNFPSILRLAKVLEQKASYHIEKFTSRYFEGKHLSAGSFMFSLADGKLIQMQESDPAN